MDFKDLKRLTVECEGWIRTARLLIQDVMGEDFVFEDTSAGFKKGTDRVGSTDSKTTVIEVRIIFQLAFDLFFIDLYISKFHFLEQQQFNKLTSDFHASFLLLIMNFVITLSK